MVELYWPDRPRILSSYAFPHTVNYAMRVPGVDLLVDSGAFSAYTTGKKIHLEEYCEWLNINANRITTAVVLDVIGDWRGTARNTEKMMQLVDTSRVNLLPVWHSTSPLEELDRLCREYDYIGVGGVTEMAKSVKQFMQHSIRAHKVARQHGTRLHGLGVTGNTSMTRLPWSTVDSSSFTFGARQGKPLLSDRYFKLTMVRAGEPIKDPRMQQVIRAYGMGIKEFTTPGFGLKSGGSPYYREQSEWLWRASARAFINMEGHIRRKNSPDGRVYLACASTGVVDEVYSAWQQGSPFNATTKEAS